MAVEYYRKLTEQEQRCFAPKLEEKARLKEAIDRLDQDILLMAALLEPEIMDPASGVELDLNRRAFCRPLRGPIPELPEAPPAEPPPASTKKRRKTR